MNSINSSLNDFITNGLSLFIVIMLVLAGCDTSGTVDSNNDDELTGNSETYTLQSGEGSNVSGTATFEEMTDGRTLITLELNGTQGGGEHPAHIHANSAVEGGGIDINLNPVDGGSGSSETEVNSLNDGTAVTYDDLIAYNGHINVHQSSEDLSTIISRGDIGGNALTGESMEYDLQEAAGSGASGIVRFEERVNGNTLATIEMNGTASQGIQPAHDGVEHPSHIHDNSVVEGGGVAVPFNNVDAETGVGQTNIDADEHMSYSEILNFDGHVNIHRNPDDFTVIASGDIGGNAMTGESMEYDLQEAGGSGASGIVRFEERMNGNTLATIEMNGTASQGIQPAHDGVEHPSHIHDNSVVEGGGVAVPFNNVDAETGIGQTNIDADEHMSYSEILNFDGHVNIHRNPDDFTVITSGDIGGNALTGESMEYDLGEMDGSGVSGIVRFEERMNENTLATIEVNGTMDGGSHPAHIHENSVAEGGGIAVPLNNVDGATGISQTNILADETLTYSEALEYNGHVNVHRSDDDFTVIAAGDIGANQSEDDGSSGNNDGNDDGSNGGDDGGNDDDDNGGGY